MLEAAVVARQDENDLEKPAAFVVVHKNVDPSDALTRELQDLVAQKLGSYKRPRWIEFLTELPRLRRESCNATNCAIERRSNNFWIDSGAGNLFSPFQRAG